MFGIFCHHNVLSAYIAILRLIYISSYSQTPSVELHHLCIPPRQSCCRSCPDTSRLSVVDIGWDPLSELSCLHF